MFVVEASGKMPISDTPGAMISSDCREVGGKVLGKKVAVCVETTWGAIT